MQKRVRVQNEGQVRGKYPQFVCTRSKDSNKKSEEEQAEVKASQSSETSESDALMGVF